MYLPGDGPLLKIMIHLVQFIISWRFQIFTGIPYGKLATVTPRFNPVDYKLLFISMWPHLPRCVLL